MRQRVFCNCEKWYVYTCKDTRAKSPFTPLTISSQAPYRTTARPSQEISICKGEDLLYLAFLKSFAVWDATELTVEELNTACFTYFVCRKNVYFINKLQYVASVGSGYQHQKGAKVLLTTYLGIKTDSTFRAKALRRICFYRLGSE